MMTSPRVMLTSLVLPRVSQNETLTTLLDQNKSNMWGHMPLA